MRDKESGGMDKAIDRHLDSDGRNSEGVERRLGRDYEPMSRSHKGSSKRGKKSKRSAASKRRG